MSFPICLTQLGARAATLCAQQGGCSTKALVCLEGELLAGMRAGLLLAAVVPSFGWVLDSPLQRRTVPEEEG